MLELLIKNGTIVNAEHSNIADVGIKDGKIVLLGDASQFPEADRTIDAAGQYVLPGMIDAHVHINSKGPEFPKTDSFYDATLAAAYGGTTSILMMAIPQNGESTLQAVERRIEEAKESVVDYSFHACVTRGTDQSLREVAELITGGITSIKMFTVYRGRTMADMGTIHEVYKVLKRHGGLAVIHAESAEIIEYNVERLVAEGKTTPPYHAISRPPISEVQGITSLLPFIQEFSVPTLFVHLSAPQAKDYLKRFRPVLPLFTEVCTHYLALTDEVYQRPDGEKFYCCPPIRSQQDRDDLWNLIREGLVDVVNSDHSGYTTEDKAKYKNNFPKAPYGLPGIETRGTVLFSEGVAKGRISINQFVALTSSNNAKLMGMYPQKGRIAIGSDADIVVLDPNAKHTLSSKLLYPVNDYTPFEGVEITGKALHTIVRGNIVIENGRAVAGSFHGNLIPRKGPMAT